MKKSILKLGIILNKKELKTIKGSFGRNGSTKECKILPWCSGLDNYNIFNCACFSVVH